MIPAASIERAIEIAARAHAGQVDKAGAPYIIYPLRVMLSIRTPYERMAAVLHDVVEDKVVTPTNLRADGIPDEVLEAIDALTKRPGETRMQAAQRAALNPIARRIKMADVSDNMDLSRIANPTEKDLNRMREYAAVKDYCNRRSDISFKHRRTGAELTCLCAAKPYPSVNSEKLRALRVQTDRTSNR